MFSHDQSSALLRPVVSPTRDVRFAPPLTEFTTPLPPSSPPPTIPIITRPPHSHRPTVNTPNPVAPGVEISSLNHVGEPPAVIDLPPRVNGGDSRPDELIGPPRDPEEGEEGGAREGDRRSRDRRRKKGRGRRKRKRSGEPEGDAQPATEEQPVHNHIHRSIPEAVPVAGATQVGVANLPPPTPVYRIVGDGMRGPEAPPLLSSQQAVSRWGRGRKGSTGDFRFVRIKQEPLEDEQGRDIFHFQFIPTHTHTHAPQILLHTHTVHVL